MADTEKQSKLSLGFIGMGAMGSRMAGRLLDAGYDLTVYNREPENTRPLAQRGAKVADTPKMLAASVDMVFCSVTNDAALEEVILGPDGALAGARSGAVIIQMSTVSPRISRHLYETAAVKRIPVLDAPVSGSTPQAEQGQLVIFVGGDEASYNRCKPILAVLGKESFYMGPSGSGAIMKICVNTLLGVGMQALAEVVALGRKAGFPIEHFLHVLGETPVLSPSQKSKFDNITRGEYPPTFPVRLMFKDFGLILDEAIELSVPMPSTASAAQMYAVEQARQTGTSPDEDFSVIIRAMLEMAGMTV